MQVEMTLVIKKIGNRVSLQFGHNDTKKPELVVALGLLERAKFLLMETHKEADFGQSLTDSQEKLIDAAKMSELASKVSQEKLQEIRETFSSHGGAKVLRKLPRESEEDD